MPTSAVYNALAHIATSEFADIVIGARVLLLPTGDPHKLCLNIADASLLDVYLSHSSRYSYHWDRRLIAKNDIYRHDNAPLRASSTRVRIVSASRARRNTRFAVEYFIVIEHPSQLP